MALTTAGWSLLVAVVGLVIALIAVSIAIVVLRRSKPCVHVTWEGAFPMYRDGRVGDRHVAVTATNDGYGATTITAWGFAIDGNEWTLVDLDPDPWLPTIPYRLGPQDAVTWQVPVTSIATSLCNAGRPNATLTAFVTLVTGRRITAGYKITANAFGTERIPEPVIDLRANGNGHVDVTKTEH